jgi:enoyl-CoA hydratase/carnithine racemase
MLAHRVNLPAALDFAGIDALAAAIDQAIADADTRVIRLEGKDSVFCRGMDLEAVTGHAAAEQKAHGVARFGRCLQAIANSPKPTMAVVDGAAEGGGLGIAAACDVILASDRARFALPEVLLGLVPAVILPFLLNRMSPQKVKRWALTGKSHDPMTAREAGLVDEVIAGSDLESACRRWERDLARANLKAVATLKRFVAEAIADPQAALEAGVRLTSQSIADEAIMNPIRAFLRDGVAPWEKS